jgi:ribonuclease HI
MGIDIFHGYGFGMAKPSGFVLVAISRLEFNCTNNIAEYEALLLGL